MADTDNSDKDKSDNLVLMSEKPDQSGNSDKPVNSDKPDKDMPHKMTLRSHKSVSSPVLSPVYDERRMSIADEGKSECSEVSSLDDEASRCVINQSINQSIMQLVTRHMSV